MDFLDNYIANNSIVAWIVITIAFIILAKSADIFVESAIGIAERYDIPKLVIGIILVSLATTAPELSVSLISAIQGKPEMALGNAIGSVICDDGLALALAGLFAATPILVIPRVLKTSGIFLIFIEIVAFLFVAWDYTLSRGEGIILVLLFFSYIALLWRQHREGKLVEPGEPLRTKPAANISLLKITFLFTFSLVGILLASKFVVVSAITIAHSLNVPESVIALTMVALGTSIPEVATCIIAARKGHGAVAVGNIIGADIMNICWVAGASAIANPLVLSKSEIYFMFPAMFIIVLLMLLMLRHKYRLTRWNGLTLLVLYGIYLAASFYMFPPDPSKELDNPGRAVPIEIQVDAELPPQSD